MSDFNNFVLPKIVDALKATSEWGIDFLTKLLVGEAATTEEEKDDEETTESG